MKKGIESRIHRVAEDHRRQISLERFAGLRSPEAAIAGFDTVDVGVELLEHLVRRKANVVTERTQRPAPRRSQPSFS